MPRKSTLVVAVLLGMLFAVGYTEAAERGSTTRTPSDRSVATSAAQVQSSNSLSLSKILRLRFLRTWQLLVDLEETQPEPPVLSTNGLSDGPDPIEGSAQSNSGPPPPVVTEGSNNHRPEEDGVHDGEHSSLQLD